MTNSRLNILIEGLLKEDQPMPPPKNSQEFAPVEAPKAVSLDQVVDRYLIRYEKEAIPTMDSYEEELYSESSLSSLDEFVNGLMNEAEGDDELDLGGGEDDAADAPADDAGGGDELDLGGDLGGDEPAPDDGGDAGGGGSEGGSGEPTVASTPQINLQDFARSVARLVNNYEQLLNPRETILNRVESYVKNNYDERTAQELMDILSTNYSLSTMETQEEQEEEFPQPYAVGALSSGS